MDVDKLNPSEAKKLVDNYIAIIAKSMYGDSVTEEQKNALKKSLGFESIDTDAKVFQNKLTYFNNDDDSGTGQWKKSYNTDRQKELNEWATSLKVTSKELDTLKEKGYSADDSIETLTQGLKSIREIKS